MNNPIIIKWKYNQQTILTTKENDFHCSIQEVKIWIEGDIAKFSLLRKRDWVRQVFSFSWVKEVNKLEVWVNGTYHQLIKILLPKEAIKKGNLPKMTQ